MTEFDKFYFISYKYKPGLIIRETIKIFLAFLTLEVIFSSVMIQWIDDMDGVGVFFVQTTG